MAVTRIFPGSFYISDGDHALLAGCPPEIVKVLLQRGLKAPGHILLPDVPVTGCESQVAVEFPLYYHLFSGASKAGLKPLNLIGSARRVNAAAELLGLSLFGPTAEQMQDWGMPEEQAEALARETRWFAPKGRNGKPLSIDALVSKTILRDDGVDLGWVRIKRLRPNVFQVAFATGREHTMDLTPECEQAPPYPVPPDLTPTTLVKLGVEVLGGSTGFSTTQASSGMALCYNGHYLLIDAVPYLNHHLQARGIARNQVQSLFLSHIHDDHCNLLSLLQYNRRIQILTTPLIYRMMLRKLSLTLDRPEHTLEGYFSFVALAPGEETNFFGLRITPCYSSHSVPTIGAYFETTHDTANYRIIFTGDTQSLRDLTRMQKTGVITRDRFQQILDFYRKPAQLLIADGGEGAIHGDPSDAVNSPAERILFLHLDKLSDRFDTHFSTASAGKRFCVLRGETDFNLTRTIEFLLEYFPDMPPMWISHLLANQRVLQFNAGDIIIREGACSDGCVYMILTGHASVIHHDGTQKHHLADMEAGEIIGEMSILVGQGIRNASVMAESPVIVTAISEIAFREYVLHQNLEPKLKLLWENRELLQTLPYLRPLQQPVLRELSTAVTLEHLTPRSGARPLKSICAPFSLLMPLDQKIVLKYNAKTEIIPLRGAPVFCRPGVTLVTEAEFQYLLLRREQASELRARIPAFRYFWEETLGLPAPEKSLDRA